MKLNIGGKIFVVPLAVALISGTSALSQQQSGAQSGQRSGQQSGQQSGQRGTTPTTPGATNRDSAAQPKTLDTNRDANAKNDYSRQGMYDRYKAHWESRYNDPAFIEFMNEQMKVTAPNSAPNRQGTMTYQQFSEKQDLWNNPQQGSTAWQRSGAYWRTSDRYWRDPERRQSKDYDDYWRKSQEYWNDSDKYWDQYYANPDMNKDTNILDRDREHTNK